jgi:ubiquinone biosynthesis protein
MPVNSLRNLRRFGAISRVLLRHGFGGLLDRMSGPSPSASAEPAAVPPAERTASLFPSPVRVRQALEELGPSFIKLGQILSVRADIFPPNYIEELKKLQDQAPSVPKEAIRRVVESELGGPLSDHFAEFSPEPLAAASVAQVHRARLHSGEDVAVKVIRPGIAVKIRDDVRVMYLLAERAEKALEIARLVGAVNLVKEFERTIFRELDMFIEAGNLEKFAANFRDSREIYIGRVHWDHVRRSVMVMEFIPGVKMDQVAAIRSHGLDPKEVALIGLRSFSRQLMEFGYFHADPHPANTLVMYDGRVSLVDFGIIGYLDEETMAQIATLFLGFAEHDYGLVMDALEDAGLFHDKLDRAAFRVDLKDMSEPFYGRSLGNISVRDVYNQVMGLVLKYEIRMPRNLLLLLKTFVQTEALGKILGSDASLLEVTRPYARRLLQRGYDARKLFRGAGREARTFGGYLRSAPRLLHQALQRTARGEHRVTLRHDGFDPLVSRLEKGLNRAVVGGLIAASTIAGSLILSSPVQILTLRLGDEEIALSALLGITGYSIATLLGVWLIISIFRSGKL